MTGTLYLTPVTPKDLADECVALRKKLSQERIALLYAGGFLKNRSDAFRASVLRVQGLSAGEEGADR